MPAFAAAPSLPKLLRVTEANTHELKVIWSCHPIILQQKEYAGGIISGRKYWSGTCSMWYEVCRCTCTLMLFHLADSLMLQFEPGACRMLLLPQCHLLHTA